MYIKKRKTARIGINFLRQLIVRIASASRQTRSTQKQIIAELYQMIKLVKARGHSKDGPSVSGSDHINYDLFSQAEQLSQEGPEVSDIHEELNAQQFVQKIIAMMEDFNRENSDSMRSARTKLERLVKKFSVLYKCTRVPSTSTTDPVSQCLSSSDMSDTIPFMFQEQDDQEKHQEDDHVETFDDAIDIQSSDDELANGETIESSDDEKISESSQSSQSAQSSDDENIGENDQGFQSSDDESGNEAAIERSGNIDSGISADDENIIESSVDENTSESSQSSDGSQTSDSSDYEDEDSEYEYCGEAANKYDNGTESSDEVDSDIEVIDLTKVCRTTRNKNPQYRRIECVTIADSDSESDSCVL